MNNLVAMPISNVSLPLRGEGGAWDRGKNGSVEAFG